MAEEAQEKNICGPVYRSWSVDLSAGELRYDEETRESRVGCLGA